MRPLFHKGQKLIYLGNRSGLPDHGAEILRAGDECKCINPEAVNDGSYIWIEVDEHRGFGYTQESFAPIDELTAEAEKKEYEHATN